MLPEFFNTAITEAAPYDSRETQSQASDYSSYNSSRAFVVSLGGSLLYKEGAIDAEAVRQFASAIDSLHSQGYKLAIVVGGGFLAKQFVEAGRNLNCNNFELDELGISATKLNAQLFIQALEHSHKEVLSDFKKAKTIIASNKIPVFGGILPGVTTDFDAALLAEFLGATFINLSNVDGIYDSNPKENPDAKIYRELTYDALIDILLQEESKPRQNLILDVPATLILKRSKITGFFLNGNNIPNFEAAVRGDSFEGTIVSANAQILEPEETEQSTEEETEISKPKRKPAARKKALSKKKKKSGLDNADKIAMGLKL